jgi:tetratricopeptide (TPR) repeat protein
LLTLARAHGNSIQIARSLYWLSILTEQDGNLDQALQLLEQATEQIPNHKHESWPVLNGLALLLYRMGDYERSEFMVRDFVRECLKYASNVHHAIACGLFDLSLIAVGRKQYPRAARLYGASMRLREELRWPIWTLEAQMHDHVVPLIQAALGQDEWYRLCAEGAAMTQEQATELAMLDEPLQAR